MSTAADTPRPGLRRLAADFVRQFVAASAASLLIAYPPIGLLIGADFGRALLVACVLAAIVVVGYLVGRFLVHRLSRWPIPRLRPRTRWLIFLSLLPLGAIARELGLFSWLDSLPFFLLMMILYLVGPIAIAFLPMWLVLRLRAEHRWWVYSAASLAGATSLSAIVSAMLVSDVVTDPYSRLFLRWFTLLAPSTGFVFGTVVGWLVERDERRQAG